MIEAVLFDWGDTLMRWEWEAPLLETAHRAGLAAIGRDGMPEADALATHFTETYLPFLWLPGAQSSPASSRPSTRPGRRRAGSA